MPSVTTNICSNFSAPSGDDIIFTGVPPACTITQDGSKPWPFTLGPPIVFPLPSTLPVRLKNGLAPGTYCYVVSCCNNKVVCVTIT
jgi:hypothetical protein